MYNSMGQMSKNNIDNFREDIHDNFKISMKKLQAEIIMYSKYQFPIYIYKNRILYLMGKPIKLGKGFK